MNYSLRCFVLLTRPKPRLTWEMVRGYLDHHEWGRRTHCEWHHLVGWRPGLHGERPEQQHPRLTASRPTASGSPCLGFPAMLGRAFTLSQNKSFLLLGCLGLEYFITGTGKKLKHPLSYYKLGLYL